MLLGALIGTDCLDLECHSFRYPSWKSICYGGHCHPLPQVRADSGCGRCFCCRRVMGFFQGRECKISALFVYKAVMVTCLHSGRSDGFSSLPI